jgi:hypothetical protein
VAGSSGDTQVTSSREVALVQAHSGCGAQLNGPMVAAKDEQGRRTPSPHRGSAHVSVSHDVGARRRHGMWRGLGAVWRNVVMTHDLGTGARHGACHDLGAQQGHDVVTHDPGAESFSGAADDSAESAGGDYTTSHGCNPCKPEGARRGTNTGSDPPPREPSLE